MWKRSVIVYVGVVLVGIVQCKVVRADQALTTCVDESWGAGLIGAKEIDPGILTACFDLHGRALPWRQPGVFIAQERVGCLDVILSASNGGVFVREDTAKSVEDVKRLERVSRPYREGVWREKGGTKTVLEGGRVRIVPSFDGGVPFVIIAPTPAEMRASFQGFLPLDVSPEESVARWSPDQKHLAVFYDESGLLEIWGRDEHKVMSIPTDWNYKKPGYGNNMCGDVSWLSDRLVLVEGNVCAGPGGEAWVLDVKKKRRVAMLGGRSEEYMNHYGMSLVRLYEDVWAFVVETTGKLIVQNMATGTVLWKRDLTKYSISEGDSKAFEEFEHSDVWVAALSDGRVGVMLGGVRGGNVLVFNQKSGAFLFEVLATRCDVTVSEGVGSEKGIEGKH